MISEVQVRERLGTARPTKWALGLVNELVFLLDLAIRSFTSSSLD